MGSASWGKKPFQPTNTPRYIDLFSDPRFKTMVQLRHLLGMLAKFVEQSSVLEFVASHEPGNRGIPD